MGLEGGAVDLALLWSLPGLETNEKQPHELCLPHTILAECGFDMDCLYAHGTSMQKQHFV